MATLLKRLVGSLIILALVRLLLIKKGWGMVIPPGISVEEWQCYLYLSTLNYLCGFMTAVAQVDACHVRTILATAVPAQCGGCGRWYLIDIQYCPVDNGRLCVQSPERFLAQVADWEAFRLAYSDHTHTVISRLMAMRLHRMAQRREEYA